MIAAGMAYMRRIILALFVLACGEPRADSGDEPVQEPAPAPSAQETASCDAATARSLAERLGSRLNDVSVLAPDSIVERELRAAYADLVTPELLESWIANPESAPGRRTSSPWPDRLEVRSVTAECVVAGEVVLVASTGEAGRERVQLEVSGGPDPRVVAWRTLGDGAAVAEPDASNAVATLHRYYAAIDARDYARAYALWADSGRASGQSYEAFAAGFAQTAGVRVETGAPGRIEGAAGSRYVEVPVEVEAVTTNGRTQRFEGTYTLRRSVVDGATTEQQQWRIYSARIAEID